MESNDERQKNTDDKKSKNKNSTSSSFCAFFTTDDWTSATVESFELSFLTFEFVGLVYHKKNEQFRYLEHDVIGVQVLWLSRQFGKVQNRTHFVLFRQCYDSRISSIDRTTISFQGRTGW